MDSKIKGQRTGWFSPMNFIIIAGVINFVGFNETPETLGQSYVSLKLKLKVL